MRRTLLTSLFFIYTLCSYSQSADKGVFHANLGLGVGVLTTNSNAELNRPGYALPTLAGIELGYNTHERVSLGLEVFSHTYSTADTAIISVGGGGLGIDLKYYLSNKEKSNTFIGTTIGGMNLTYNGYNYPDSGSTDNTKKNVWTEASGIYNKVYIGYNKYFGNTFGLYIKAGVLNIPFRMNYFTIDDVELDYIDKMPVTSWKALFRGGFVNFGFTFKFGGKKSEKVEDESKE